MQEGKNIHVSAKASEAARYNKKLLGKSTWFKGGKEKYKNQGMKQGLNYRGTGESTRQKQGKGKVNEQATTLAPGESDAKEISTCNLFWTNAIGIFPSVSKTRLGTLVIIILNTQNVGVFQARISTGHFN